MSKRLYRKRSVLITHGRIRFECNLETARDYVEKHKSAVLSEMPSVENGFTFGNPLLEEMLCKEKGRQNYYGIGYSSIRGK